MKTLFIFLLLRILHGCYGVPVYINPDTIVIPEHLRLNVNDQSDGDNNLPQDPRPPPEVTEAEADSALMELGFLDKNYVVDDLITRLDQVEKDRKGAALRKFQRTYQIPETGRLDDDTRRLIAAPKCGTAELNDASFVWTKPTVTYKINSLPANLEPTLTRQLITQAFNEWTQHVNLDVVEITEGDADIYVSDEGAVHQNRLGDNCYFSRNTTLAHAFYPEVGDIHYNSERTYKPDEFSSMTMHEIGHTLGLDHTTSQSSIMFPMHLRYHREIPLEDRTALQALYGIRPVRKTIKKPKPTSLVGSAPRLCSLAKFDTILNDADGQTFVLAGNYYYALSERNPRGQLISSKWPSLPRNINAAFTYRNRKTFFFKGTQMWVYVDDQLEAGYPKLISEELPGLPNSMDAAYITRAGSILAIKKNKYWFYNPSKRPQVGTAFPRLVYDFNGMPVNINAAMRHTDGRFYFFKGRNYYTLDSKNFTVDAGNPVENMWFKC